MNLDSDYIERKLVGYCSYCKDAIFTSDDFVRDKGSTDHKECWKRKKNIVEELNFDEEN